MQKTILVVDDDPLFADLVKDMLEVHHYDVVVAFNGEQALSLLAERHFDVVVSDIEMPVMNGIVFHARLIASELYRTIPFVFLTASVDPEKLHYVDAHPPAVLVSKAEMVERLVATIAEMTSSHSPSHHK
jgi:CheY-like chemotaxis protein